MLVRLCAIIRYHASHPFWYRRRREKGIHRFGYATTVADSLGDTYLHGGQGQYQSHQQSLEEQEQCRWQQQLALSQSMSTPTPPAIQDASPYPADQMFQSQLMNTTDDEETTTTLSHETRLKIEELKRLVYKYPQYHSNPGGVIACVIHFCNEVCGRKKEL
jgi:hypothetical protein